MMAESADDEPRVRDEEVAKRLGYARPRKFRDLLRELHKDGELPGVLVRPELGRASMPRGGERSTLVDVFYLTEANVVVATMRARTENARAFRQAFAAIVVKARRELRSLPVSGEAYRVDVALLNGPRICDDAGRKASMQRIIKETARIRGWKTGALVASLRRVLKVPSPYYCSLLLAPIMERMCDEYTRGIDPEPPPSAAKPKAPSGDEGEGGAQLRLVYSR